MTSNETPNTANNFGANELMNISSSASDHTKPSKPLKSNKHPKIVNISEEEQISQGSFVDLADIEEEEEEEEADSDAVCGYNGIVYTVETSTNLIQDVIQKINYDQVHSVSDSLMEIISISTRGPDSEYLDAFFDEIRGDGSTLESYLYYALNEDSCGIRPKTDKQIIKCKHCNHVANHVGVEFYISQSDTNVFVYVCQYCYHAGVYETSTFLPATSKVSIDPWIEVLDKGSDVVDKFFLRRCRAKLPPKEIKTKLDLLMRLNKAGASPQTIHEFKEDLMQQFDYAL